MDFLKWELMLVGILQRKVIMDILPLWDRFLVVISPKSSIPKKRREICPLHTSRTNFSRLSSSPWGSYHDELDNQSSSFNQLN